MPPNCHKRDKKGSQPVLRPSSALCVVQPRLASSLKQRERKAPPQRTSEAPLTTHRACSTPSWPRFKLASARNSTLTAELLLQSFASDASAHFRAQCRWLQAVSCKQLLARLQAVEQADCRQTAPQAAEQFIQEANHNKAKLGPLLFAAAARRPPIGGK